MSKIGRPRSKVRELVEAWADTLFQDTEWEYESRRQDVVWVMYRLCLPAADDVFAALNGERTRRQVAAERLRGIAERGEVAE